MAGRRLLLAALLVGAVSGNARAEWQLKPFLGATIGGETTLVDPEGAIGRPNPTLGLSAMLLGEVVGIEGDFALAPGFFQYGSRSKPLVLSSNVTTISGNVVVAVPRRIAEYTLRPYAVGGIGLMRVTSDIASFGVFDVATTLPAFDIGGGVTGFLSNRVGVGWELRHFSSFHGQPTLTGVSLGPEQLSFWRANMALVIRY